MKYKKLCHFSFCEGKNEKGRVGTNRSQLLVLRTVSFIGRRCSSSKDGLKIQETMSVFFILWRVNWIFMFMDMMKSWIWRKNHSSWFLFEFTDVPDSKDEHAIKCNWKKGWIVLILTGKRKWVSCFKSGKDHFIFMNLTSCKPTIRALGHHVNGELWGW